MRLKALIICRQVFFKSITAAPFIAHHFTLGRRDYSQWMAFYLQKPDDDLDYRFYQRYVLRYTINKTLFAGVGLKTHGHVAENMDVRLGWNF